MAQLLPMGIYSLLVLPSFFCLLFIYDRVPNQFVLQILQWAQNGGLKDCALEYAGQLEWYDSLLRSNDYVLGATIFSLEIPGWDSFDIGGQEVADLINYMR